MRLPENETPTCKTSKATLLLNMQICDVLLSWLLKLPNRAKRHFKCVKDE